MFKKVTIRVAILVFLIITGGTFLWQQLATPRQSSIRLMYQLNLKELLITIDSYQDSYNTIPKDLKELKSAGMISTVSDFDQFEYVAGFQGILAYQREPFRKVKKGEPWGRPGEVAQHDIPAARLILFTDGSIQFVDESDFQVKYRDLLFETKIERTLRQDQTSFSEIRPDRFRKPVRSYPNRFSGIALTKKENIALEELIPEMNWSEWYRQTSGYSCDPKYFGAYVTLPVGNDLYIGLGTGLPSLGDGALIARFDGKNIEPIGSLAEEGVHEMIWDHQTGTLHIAGTDPSWPDDWSAGNHYTYNIWSGSKIVKHRDPENGLVNADHTWGLWMSDDHVLYAVVSAHDGSFTDDRNLLRRGYNRIRAVFNDSYYSTDYGVTRMGQVFKSTDNGINWYHLSNLGYFRAYDIIGFDDKLYAIYTDMPKSPSKLAVSEDGGETWRDVTQSYVQQVHLIQFQDKLLAVSLGGQSFYTVSANTLTTYDLPEGFRVDSSFVETYFNVLAVGNGYLYAITTAEDGPNCILQTSDLRDWEQVACTDQRLISLSYWPAQGWLVVSGTGSQAKLWKADLNQGSELQKLDSRLSSTE